MRSLAPRSRKTECVKAVHDDAMVTKEDGEFT
jgi:hypothetical protein